MIYEPAYFDMRAFLLHYCGWVLYISCWFSVVMKFTKVNSKAAARYVTLFTIGVMLLWGGVSVMFEIRPFWVDEWRIIYNLKFRDVPGLWGKLDFMQQFPRTYLSIMKEWTSTNDYSYFSLRLPSYLVGVTAMALMYRMAERIFPAEKYQRFLMVLMLVSCGTFTEYFVEVKQYTMDLLLSIVAVWQMRMLLLVGEKKVTAGWYVLLCIVFLVAPFFSYTYPIVIAPVFAVMLVHNVLSWRERKWEGGSVPVFMMQWLPLFLCTFSMTVFYLKDAYMPGMDEDMHRFWAHLMMEGGFDPLKFFVNFFHFFAQAGSGFVFWWLFGVFCSISFGYGIYRTILNLRGGMRDQKSMMLLYSVLLPMVVMVLYIAGKLPVGEPRLSAFAVPAISIMLVTFLSAEKGEKARKVFSVVSFLMFAGLSGNVVSTVVASFTDSKYARRMEIYRNTQAAITEAEHRGIPIMITPGVAYPYEQTNNLPFEHTVPGDWVLMTFPAYSADGKVPVYAIPDLKELGRYLDKMPGGVKEVMAGDGLHYKVVKVPEQALPLQ